MTANAPGPQATTARLELKKLAPRVSAAMGALHAAAVGAAREAKVEPELLELVRIRASQLNDRAASEVFDEPQVAALIWASVVINAYNRTAISARMVPGAYQPAPRT
jgi:alkylhydroperoxidase family enzyme